MIAAINLFILWYLAVAAFGHRPPRSLISRLLKPFDRIVDGLGVRQHWAMFAPDPTARSVRLHVLIRLASGAAIRWDPPRFGASRLAAFRGCRRRLFELMLAAPDGKAARRSLVGYLLRTYPSIDPPTDLVFIATESAVPPSWDSTRTESLERVIEVISVTAPDDFAVHTR